MRGTEGFGADLGIVVVDDDDGEDEDREMGGRKRDVVVGSEEEEDGGVNDIGESGMPFGVVLVVGAVVVVVEGGREADGGALKVNAGLRGCIV